MTITRRICLKRPLDKKQRYILSGIVLDCIGFISQADAYYIWNGIRVTCSEETFQKIVLECRVCELDFTIEM